MKYAHTAFRETVCARDTIVFVYSHAEGALVGVSVHFHFFTSLLSCSYRMFSLEMCGLHIDDIFFFSGKFHIFKLEIAANRQKSTQAHERYGSVAGGY